MYRNRGPCQELRRTIRVWSWSSARLQTDVRTLRSRNTHVLLPQQAYGMQGFCSWSTWRSLMTHRCVILGLVTTTSWIGCSKTNKSWLISSRLSTREPKRGEDWLSVRKTIRPGTATRLPRSGLEIAQIGVGNSLADMEQGRKGKYSNGGHWHRF